MNEFLNKSTVSILLCGRLGDFFYSLCVPSYLYKTFKIKSNIYLCEHGEKFRYGLQKTYKDLKNIMFAQKYVNNFKVYTDEEIDIDMTTWRKKGSPDFNLFKSYRSQKLTWSEFFFKKYLNGQYPPRELTNITTTKKRNEYADWLIINRVDRATKGKPISYYKKQFTERLDRLDNKSRKDIYLKYINQSKNCGFIFYEKEQYDDFLLKQYVKPIKINSLEDMVNIIGSCNMFIGNQTAPLAIAHSLNVNRVVETNIPTAWRYVYNEKNFYKNVTLLH